MPTVSIREQIKKLVELQSIDIEIYGFKRELKEKPALLEILKKQFEDKKAGLKKLEDQFKNIQVERKSKELDLQSKEELIIKANSQLSQLKTNKEYQAKLLEIEGSKIDKALIEEKILLLFDDGDSITKQIETEKAALAQAEKEYLNQKKMVENSVKELEEKINILVLKRSHIVPEVDKSNLSRYERILENKEGLAIVPIKNNTCGGCYMNTPQQVFNEIKMHDKLVFCEMCARILYLEEDL